MVKDLLMMVLVYYSGSVDNHEHGVGFIINSTVTNSVMGCQAVSSRIITTYLKATPFNKYMHLPQTTATKKQLSSMNSYRK